MSFVADAQEVQAEKKDPLVTEESSPQHGGSYAGLCYMANRGWMWALVVCKACSKSVS